MGKHVLLGSGHHILPVPRFFFDRQVHKTRPVILADDSHLVRDFVVWKIPTAGKPISPEFIGESLGIAIEEVRRILAELEKGMTFLWRGDGENVTWAYPVTVDKTPHRYTLSTGETGHAA